MVLDAYSLCPCGSGKKVKFCCSRNLVQELDKVQRALEGKQRVSALRQLDSLLKTNSQLPCLLHLKAVIELSRGSLDDAGNTLDQLLQVASKNPASIALAAEFAVLQGEVANAVIQLQLALEHLEDKMPMELFGALVSTGQALLQTGNLLAARGHLMFANAASGGNDSELASLVAGLHQDPKIPLLLRDSLDPLPCPDQVAWKGEFAAAIRCWSRGRWRLACEQLSSLDEKVPQQRAVVKNLAIVRGYLGHAPDTIAAWRRVAEMESLDLDERLEAEAVAQLLDPETSRQQLDEVRVTWTVGDGQHLSEQWLSDRQLTQIPFEPPQADSQDEPPPRHVFGLLDRLLPTSGLDLTRETVPNVVGVAYLFGKETDREARVEFVAVKDQGFSEACALLESKLGEDRGEAGNEESLGSVAAVRQALSWNWRMPDDTPRDVQQHLMDEQRREMMFEVWPSMPLSVLDDKNPREVAADGSYQVRLLAAVLLLELAAEQNQWALDFNELRRDLDLPEAGPLEIEELNLHELSVVRMCRLPFEQLSDDELLATLQLVASRQAARATRSAGLELIRRDNFENTGELDKAQLYGMLANLSGSSDEAVEYLQLARDSALATGHSPANWLLNELSLRIVRGESDVAQQVFEQIRSRHLEEPGVSENLYKILESYGILPEDNRPLTRPTGLGSATQPPTTPQPDTSNTLWTPETVSSPTTDEPQAKESKLWVPGMD
ncbi:MAG: hypothetical protein CMJ59_11200 [Planctomycetaceae bacterium]|nr:hypothetical protein [Planctomycetaceae bacterium]